MKKVQKAVGFKTPSGPMRFTDEDKMEAHGPPFPKKSAEATLARLRKLPGNKLCGTCRTPSTNRGGFADVVLTYRIFVCRDCRESHGVAGHEVRTAERLAKLDVRASLTPYEVEALARGGNEVNVATTFALLPATSFEWPTKRTASSERDQFVRAAYGEKKWASREDTPEEAPPEPAPAPAPTPAARYDSRGAAMRLPGAPGYVPPPPAAASAAPAVAVAATVSLLDAAGAPESPPPPSAESELVDLFAAPAGPAAASVAGSEMSAADSFGAVGSAGAIDSPWVPSDAELSSPFAAGLPMPEAEAEAAHLGFRNLALTSDGGDSGAGMNAEPTYASAPIAAMTFADALLQSAMNGTVAAPANAPAAAVDSDAAPPPPAAMGTGSGLGIGWSAPRPLVSPPKPLASPFYPQNAGRPSMPVPQAGIAGVGGFAVSGGGVPPRYVRGIDNNTAADPALLQPQRMATKGDIMSMYAQSAPPPAPAHALLGVIPAASCGMRVGPSGPACAAPWTAMAGGGGGAGGGSGGDAPALPLLLPTKAPSKADIMAKFG
ncbi:hypothetical protein EMIHUDRAFT_631921 [Emiliania huxleyi CCMP1516]|uniref:Arf-GAP domain-containing protein n=2 Tax=Emiliania huxleyi TaxID=2903 RepID=A0A0D3JNG7_EMIH1|nr:hypothetical protein EMIHUDRAFT_631921 [Emiliania huxleyi CCMP1516]EOD25052.1 hypothetical protein EMIHUDRAFT_631921 [Emiliania huxleyi CCMP1516]|eukprot:XP_005777481.1 hypothetical protein EMIHUDRAFT_631921 [Emiliania huxleyi CCMP1516]